MGRLLMMLLAITSGACSGDNVCTAEPRLGISLEIRDSATNAPAAAGAIAVATDGAYVDSVNVTTPLHANLAGNRGGTYTVRVRKNGYSIWQRNNIVVPGGQC